MYFAYFVKETCRTVLLFLILTLFLRQLLPLFGKRKSAFEEIVMKYTRPLWLMGECFCRMASIPLRNGGMDMRYPMAVGVLALAWLAVSVL